MEKRNYQKRIPKKTRREYFTKENERAIIAYVKEKNFRVRETLFREKIQPAFKELIEKIVFTYRFANLPDIDGLKSECEATLVMILDKFDESKGSAFSYFSVITKNWFNYRSKKLHNRDVDYEEITLKDNEDLYCLNPYLEDRQTKELQTFLAKKFIEWKNSSEFSGETEKKVLEAVELLIINVNNLEIVSKKSVYLYLREITGLPTKKIVFVLNKLRKKYSSAKVEWDCLVS